MKFEDVLQKYEKELLDSEFEIIQTPRLGWISIMTEYFSYSDPIVQFDTPEELEAFIRLRIK